MSGNHCLLHCQLLMYAQWYHLLTVPGHHSTGHGHNHDFLTLTNLELREMPACTSTIEDLLSWMKSVDTTWSSVTPRMPCTTHR